MKALDSTFIIDFLRNKKEALDKEQRLRNELLATTTVNYFEILLGILLMKENKEKKQQVFDAFMERLEIFPLHVQESQKAAAIAAHLIKNGKMIDELDYLISGILLSRGCLTIITNNEKHFKQIEGITVETY